MFTAGAPVRATALAAQGGRESARLPECVVVVLAGDVISLESLPGLCLASRPRLGLAAMALAKESVPGCQRASRKKEGAPSAVRVRHGLLILFLL